MKSYIKSIIFLSCILVGGNYVCGMEDNQILEPRIKEDRTVIAIFNIAEGNVDKDVQIINDSKCDDVKTRTGIDRIDIYELSNNNGEKVKHMEYKNKDGDITKNHRFNKQGVYMIYYYFREDVKDMSYMFYKCSTLTSLDFSQINTDKVENMAGMFYGCSSLKTLDLSKINTQSVMDMSYMFNGCSSLTNLDFSNFNTDRVGSMAGMFDGCSSLTSLDLSKFNTVLVVLMTAMFQGCSSLTSLNLSNFNTDKVINMEGMFCGCSSLKTLDLSNFNTEKVNEKDDLFYGCFNLKRVTTNDEYIDSLFKDSKAVRVLNPNSCCCPCCKNK